MSLNVQESKQDIEIVRMIEPSEDTMIKSFVEDSPLSEYLTKSRAKEDEEETKVESSKVDNEENIGEKEDERLFTST